jgi:hypothetical protein
MIKVQQMLMGSVYGIKGGEGVALVHLPPPTARPTNCKSTTTATIFTTGYHF